ncbi:general stress protein 13 [Parageobacillus sp. VR-IP]|uniref:S1 domain-containing post-transcriptional regulator GSP13 n=1 Tax=Parageobacillus sp. VR-IP TaxID=2742205 RepID=UPI0015833FC8|nr:S1 domain-containing post-transcriptional regulator GSP13 [Parageobacillus sp. VR-IP]NUK29568.1 general stress protein 13 [Parageobacillus sp. VR-IP]
MSTIEAGDIVKGKVTGIQPYGVFVELDEGIQGLVHISEISHKFVKDVRDYVHIGDEVMVKVLSVDRQTKRASLSMKALENRNKDEKRHVKVKMSFNPGFNTLKEKLQEWIEQSKKEDLRK